MREEGLEYGIWNMKKDTVWGGHGTSFICPVFEVTSLTWMNRYTNYSTRLNQSGINLQQRANIRISISISNQANNRGGL